MLGGLRQGRVCDAVADILVSLPLLMEDLSADGLKETVDKKLEETQLMTPIQKKRLGEVRDT